MKSIFLLLGLTVGFSLTAARAEDALRGRFDWTGPYVGVHLGYGKATSNVTDAEYNGGFSIFPVVKWDAKSDGAFAGFQGGYNIQNGSTVIGLEGELGYLGIKGSTMQPGLDPNGDPYDAAGTVNSGAYAALSVRLGQAIDRSLFYVKGGLAYSDAKVGFLDTCVTLPCGDGTIDASADTGWGYQLGAGVEHALSRKWTVKVEYSYFNFGSIDINGIQIGGGNDGKPAKIDSDLSIHTIKTGLNYRF